MRCGIAAASYKIIIKVKRLEINNKLLSYTLKNRSRAPSRGTVPSADRQYEINNVLKANFTETTARRRIASGRLPRANKYLIIIKVPCTSACR